MVLRLTGAMTWLGVSVLATLSGSMVKAQLSIPGTTCVSPPPLHCPDANCSNELIMHPGNTTAPKSKREFFLDYPCHLKPGEAVTFVLNLHGGGMVGNWHRHYFPLMDLKDKYRLVVAAPSAAGVLWSEENDDVYLKRIVSFVYEQIGAKNIRAFWLAGHSHGGVTARRLLMTPFFRGRVTGLVSLSGGRLGSRRAYSPIGTKSAYLLPAPSATVGPPTPEPSAARAPGVGLGDATALPDYKLSHIYTSGEYELTAAGLPDHSVWARQLGCGAQTRRPDVIDTKAGYVWSSRSPRTHQSPFGGRQPRPGRARVYVYPQCSDGHVVADVIRLDKGHTEGLEPNVTEEIIKLMLPARQSELTSPRQR
jgi:hypothetical protein